MSNLSRMKFRTEIDVRPAGFRIDHLRSGFIAGSCFSEHIYKKLTDRKFSVAANPFGIQFNPLSIGAMLRRLRECKLYGIEDLNMSDGMWFSYDHHGSFTSSSPEETLAAVNAALESGSKALATADYVVMTWGTAWIYRLAENGRPVANCHKQPACCFTRERLSVSDIVNDYAALLEGPLAGKQVLITVSPVRHVKDGMAENSLSKAVLRLAAGELTERFPCVHYFPAFEIMNDDLRDYRFYAEDMVHPSPQAVDYVWEKFTEYSMDAPTRVLLPELERLRAAISHRVMNPDSDPARRFGRSSLELVSSLERRLPMIDFSAERDYFTAIASLS